MLETRDLIKIYKPKKGVPVTALDRVNLKFSDTGMIFLLGKSGSGKSTLLNLLGGLDNYDGGEIIIKGVSSKKFKQQHFDSYRNTYVGFIFQEYNVLDEFTVGANIALAIELQNRKATNEEINNILKQVDLEGYGNRKPNELSGGQKQRVAIARALVKNPQIIMADEPTGALDSNTGKQIFDTLKKLSKEKLVIVVSHDREFAETYADRIIELSDGQVISDVEISSDSIPQKANELVYSGDTIEIPESYQLTEKDLNDINEYIKNLKQGGKLKVNSTAYAKKFVSTDTSNIKSADSSTFKLIKSKLPLKNAFKIGSSSLKYKKFRLVMTVLLSCISFGLFGLADTFGAYNHVESCTNSLIDSGVQYVATAKAEKYVEGNYSYWVDYGKYLSNEDLKNMEKNTNVQMHGVYVPLNSDLSFSHHINTNIKNTESEYDIYNTGFSGFAEINEKTVNNMGFKILAGTLPNGEKNEIAISEYIFEVIKKAGYTDGTLEESADGNHKTKYIDIKSYSDLIGKTLKIHKTEFKITAIIDTNFDISRYESLLEKKEHQTTAEELIDFILFSEFNFSSKYSYSSIAMTGEGFVDNLIANRPKIAMIDNGHIYFNTNDPNNDISIDSQYLGKLSDFNKKDIVWLDGEKQVLGEKEIIATSDCIYIYTGEDSGSESERIASAFKDGTELTSWQYDEINAKDEQIDGYKVVGYIEINESNANISSTVICNEKLYDKFTSDEDSFYAFSVGAMPKGKSEIRNLVSYCYDDSKNIRFPIQNSVTYELDSLNETLIEFSKIFLYIGIGFALFASLMLSNFIAISISYKKQEIGILRAIGSRSNDVFRIFFAESFIIAMINFVLSSIGVGILTFIINYFIRHEVGILVTILTFSLRQVALLLIVSILVAFIASYIPVKRIASKRPIDAIRDR